GDWLGERPNTDVQWATRYLAPRLAKGDILALEAIARIQLGEQIRDVEAAGAYWKEAAAKYPGTRTELDCRMRALAAYSDFFSRPGMVKWNEAEPLIREIQKQEYD